MKLRTLNAIAFALTVTMSAPPVVAENAGAYLAGRQADGANDFEAAAEYFARALLRDRNNVQIIGSALTAYLSLGELERAVPLARRLRSMDEAGQMANLTLFADHAAKGDWQRIVDDLDAGYSVGPLYDGLARAWALVGMGQMGEALNQFREVSENRGTQAFGLYHQALALASVGDFEGANAVFSGENGPNLRLTRRGVLAHAQVLAQVDRPADGALLLSEIFGSDADPVILDLRNRLEAGEPVPFDTVRNPIDGLAELHHTIASAIRGEAADTYTLLYSRVSGYLRPDHIDSLLMSAELLERIGRFELATLLYDEVPLDNPYYPAAELGRAQALQEAGRTEAAIEVLSQLRKSHPDLPAIHIQTGDLLRSLERYGEATEAYDAAIALLGAPQQSHWSLYFSRGITHEREDRWEKAEADFRKSLELQPDQPQVLNYLGYSFVEMQINLDEALDMIERAVEGRPNSGYITDSLGWVLYRLGRYDEAVEHMERAAELLPIDPIINDHLGDVYWAVGRVREAEFQWNRALSFDPEPEDAERIRRKLEVGLDTVLDEEGAPPLQVANDEG